MRSETREDFEEYRSLSIGGAPPHSPPPQRFRMIGRQCVASVSPHALRATSHSRRAVLSGMVRSPPLPLLATLGRAITSPTSPVRSITMAHVNPAINLRR